MNQLGKRQQGFTLITIIVILAVIGFFVLLIVKIAPIYMNHSKVTNALYALEQTKNIENESTHGVKRNLDGRFNINYVEHLSIDDVKIINRLNYLKVVIEYEVVEKIVGNASVLVEFYEEIEIGADG